MEKFTKEDWLELPAPNYEQFKGLITNLLNPEATVRFQDN